MSQQATVAVTLFSYPDGFEYGQKTQTLRGNFSFPGTTGGSPPAQDYYVTGGLPVVWAVEPLKTSAAPFQVIVLSTTTPVNTYLYDIATNTLRISVSGTELSNGTDIPAGVLADTVQFEATFAKFSFFAS